MAGSVEILTLADRDRWAEAHAEAGGLPSQSWSFAWGLSASGVTPRLAVVRAEGARMLLPFVERSWMGSTDVATLQGLSGASVHPDSAAPFALWKAYAQDRGWVCGYLRLSPFAQLDALGLDGELVVHEALFILDVTRDDLFSTASRTLRRKITHALRMGVTLELEPRRLADAIKTLYPASMHRLGAASNYYFADETLERWALDQECLMLGAEHAGEIQAVCLIRHTGVDAEAHLIGSAPEWRHLVPWFVWQALPHLRARRIRTLNLGSAGHPGDGLYQFKQRFNVKPHALRSLRQIYDRARYDELCSLARVASADDFFPAYRQRPR